MYANLGKAIAAFERRILFVPTRFDRYVDTDLADRTHDSSSPLDTDEVAGGACSSAGELRHCHNGARLTDAISTTRRCRVYDGASSGQRPQRRRRQALAGFQLHEPLQMPSRTTAQSSAAPRLRRELVRAYKTPSLRGGAACAVHAAGQHATLSDVIAHSDRAPRRRWGTATEPCA